jgi:hypothetical protein
MVTVGTSKTGGLKGSHNKPTGCGASWAYAPGRMSRGLITKKKKMQDEKNIQKQKFANSLLHNKTLPVNNGDQTKPLTHLMVEKL